MLLVDSLMASIGDFLQLSAVCLHSINNVSLMLRYISNWSMVVYVGLLCSSTLAKQCFAHIFSECLEVCALLCFSPASDSCGAQLSLT